ncbi:MAG: hypothetical protein AB7W59_01905 [Acidimicrobiia bacterium]
MTEDRVTINTPSTWLGADYALGLVDEIVLHDATAHFEMSTESSGYLHVWSDRHRVFARVTARRASRTERRQILAADGDRLRDYLAAVLPWTRVGRATIWSVPPWRRPAAAVLGWWEAREAAAALLIVSVESVGRTDDPGVAS